LPGSVPFCRDSAVYVVAASEGYPERPESGKVIQIGLNSSAVPSYFFSGVKQDAQNLVTSGGRVLGALGMGPNLDSARKKAYENLKEVRFSGMQFRSDVGILES